MRAIYASRLSAEYDASYEDAGAVDLVFRDYYEDGEPEAFDYYEDSEGEAYDYDSSSELFLDDRGDWRSPSRYLF